MTGRLTEKVALISGGVRGQGEAEARLFVKEGADVALGDILVEAGPKVAADICAQSGHATFTRLDVTQEADWQQAVETTLNTYGKLNILVNNAGIFRTEGGEATSLEIVEPGDCRQSDWRLAGHESRGPRHVQSRWWVNGEYCLWSGDYEERGLPLLVTERRARYGF